MARRYHHLASGGYVYPIEMRTIAELARAYGLDVGGDAGVIRVNGQAKRFDSGGWLMPGWTLAQNNTGQPERVLAPGEEGGLHVHFHGPVYGGKTGMRQAAQEFRRELLKIKRENGGIPLGLN